MAEYTSLCRAQLSAEYLHANSTTHEFLFGAMAEMIDNARDADATRMEIFSVNNEMMRGGFLLYFLDNGAGMNPKEAGHVITFGKSLKRGEDSKIGHYGNGLKSGTMRLGSDMLLFTKKDDSRTCIFLSRTFLEEEKLDEVVVPLPSFKKNSKEPYHVLDEASQLKFRTEMQTILKYSPFHTEKEFFEQFDYIDGGNGTLIIVYNLKLLENGDPELDIETDGSDIRLSGIKDDPFKDPIPETYSLRSYSAILYHEPRMKIYVRGHKVHTNKLLYKLFKSRYYNFTSTRFKTRCAQDAIYAETDVKTAQSKLSDAESKMKQLEKNSFAKPQDRSLRAKHAKAMVTVSQLKDELRLKKQICDMAQKSLKEPKVLKFFYGINIQDRNKYGVFVYNCGRLIKMYQKVGPQIQEDDSGICRGVIGIVDIPYSVLAPTHNKQDFADAHEYRLLLRALGDHMEQYWQDSGFAKENLTKFWSDLGYTPDNWRKPPSDDPKFLKIRSMKCPIRIQCDTCLKWRTLPFSSTKTSFSDYSSDWSCSMNLDLHHNKCSNLEEIWSCSEGKLTKTVKASKSKETLKKEITKLQKQYNTTKDDQEVSSSNQVDPNAAFNRRNTKTPSVSSSTHPSSKPRSLEHGRQASFPPSSTPRRNASRAASYMSKKEVPAPQIPKAVPKSVTPKPTPRTSHKKEVPSKNSSTPKIPKRKRIISDSESDEAMETDDYEEEVLLPKKASRSKTKSLTKELPIAKKIKATSITEEDIPPPPKKILPPKGDLNSSFAVESPKMTLTKTDNKKSDADGSKVLEEKKIQKVKPFEVEKKQDETSDESTATEYSVGSNFELLINGNWVPAVVTAVDGSKYTYIIKEVKLETHLSSQVMRPAPADVPLDPQDNKAILEKLIDNFKKVLDYFCPPSWPINKSDMANYTKLELAEISVKDFFKQYEEGLGSWADGFRSDTAAVEKKLGELRKMVAHFLNLVDEELEISLEDTTQRVDDLLRSCIDQMIDSQNQQNN